MPSYRQGVLSLKTVADANAGSNPAEGATLFIKDGVIMAMKKLTSQQIVNGIWETILTVLEITLEVIKGGMILLGVLASNVADFAFGAIAATILFGGADFSFYGYRSAWLASLISLSTSAIQIILWNWLRQRGFKFKEIFNFRKMSDDVQFFLAIAVGIWALDTALDISPLALLVAQSGFQAIPKVNIALVWIVGAIMFLITGFSEPLTANIRYLIGGKRGRVTTTQESQATQSTADAVRAYAKKGGYKASPKYGVKF